MNIDQQEIVNFFYINLDTISRIQDGYKLYMNKDNTINIEEPYMFQGLWRYCYNISRKDAINVLTKLFNDIEIYFNALYVKNLGQKQTLSVIQSKKIMENDLSAFVNIISKLENAIPGLENLKKTYLTDVDTCNELNRIIEKTKCLICNFSKMI
jgi:hypothetical protein